MKSLRHKFNLRGRQRRRIRVRKKMNGTAERPRVSVFRSAKHIYVQVVDDLSGKTLASASTLSKDLPKAEGGKKGDVAKSVGALLAKHCEAAGIKEVVFDRNGYRYHGRVKAVAEGAREGGLKL